MGALFAVEMYNLSPRDATFSPEDVLPASC
jgi:hypothetical protein